MSKNDDRFVDSGDNLRRWRFAQEYPEMTAEEVQRFIAENFGDAKDKKSGDFPQVPQPKPSPFGKKP